MGALKREGTSIWIELRADRWRWRASLRASFTILDFRASTTELSIALPPAGCLILHLHAHGIRPGVSAAHAVGSRLTGFGRRSSPRRHHANDRPRSTSVLRCALERQR